MSSLRRLGVGVLSWQRRRQRPHSRPFRVDSFERPNYRTPPHNTEIEAALIGAILTNNRAHEKVSEFLRADHFYEPVLGRIYDAATKLIEQGQVASPPTLKHYFERDPALTDVGGAEFLFDLAVNAVMIVNVEDLGRSIYDLYLKRELIHVGEDIVNEAYEPDIDVKASEQLEAAEQRLYDLASTGQTERSYFKLRMPPNLRCRRRKRRISGILILLASPLGFVNSTRCWVVSIARIC